MSRKYYLEHREELLKKAMKRYIANKEEIKRRRKELYLLNRDKLNKKRRELYHITPELKEKRKKQDKQYYERNKKKVLESRHRYYIKNREKVDMTHAEWGKNNPDKMRVIWLRRKREQTDRGFVPLFDNPFPSEIDVDYHHVYSQFMFTVPMPRKIHQNYNMDLEKHIEYNKKWFEKLYSMGIDSLLGLKPCR